MVIFQNFIKFWKADETACRSRFTASTNDNHYNEYGKNIWQERYYDHVVRNDQDYKEVWEYIDYNPLKWQLEQIEKSRKEGII